MFQVSIWDLISGYQFPELNNPVSDAEGAVGEEIPGEEGAAVPWSGVSVQLNPMDPVYSVLNYLLAPPEQNKPEAITLTDIVESVKRFGDALTLAFNPIAPGSFLLKGGEYTSLTPLFMPLVPWLCPQCDLENPGDPTPFEDDSAPETADVSPETSSRSAATTVASQVASVTEGVDEDNSAEVTPTEESTTAASSAEEALDDQDTGADGITAADIEKIMAEEAADEDSSVDESASTDKNAAVGDNDGDSASEESTSQDAGSESDADSAGSGADADSGDSGDSGADAGSGGDD